jgi:hypothetical protein
LNPPQFFSVTPVWNNEETIFECLTALDNFVDKLIICEGKWIGYDGEVRSTDNTINEIVRFIKTAKHEVIFMMLPEPKHQYEVRNAMINAVPTDSWFIVMDSDEICMAYETQDKINQLLNEDKKGYCIRTYDEVQGDIVTGHLMDMPKIWRKVNGLQYTKNHRYMEVNGEPVIYNTKDFPATDFCFRHQGAYKKTRQQAEAYKNWLINWEPYP